MTGQAVGEVVESQDPRFAPGDLVVGQLGWQDYAVARGGSLRKLDPDLAPPQTALHVLGATGLTAYFGLFDVGEAKPGDTVVVSAASGAVGQVVGQLAKIAGCGPVVGLAGSAEKVADLTGLYGYDVGIDYKRDDVNARLKEACPNGVDVYFDNVGGALSETVFRRLALGRAHPGLRADLAVQPGRAGAGAAQPRLPDRLPRAARGVPDLRLRPSLPRGPAAPRPLARRGQAHLPGGRDRGARERSGGVHGDAPRREPRQGARPDQLTGTPAAWSARRSISAFAGACATSPLAGSPATSSGSRPSRPVEGIAERPLLLNIA